MRWARTSAWSASGSAILGPVLSLIVVQEQHAAIGAARLARREPDAEAPAAFLPGAGEDKSRAIARGRGDRDVARAGRILVPARHDFRPVGACEAQLDLALRIALGA